MRRSPHSVRCIKPRIMLWMANRAYASLWCKEFSEATMLAQLERLLETVPLSSSLPGFASLVIRAVGPEEGVFAEHDLRAQRIDAAAVAELARQHQHADCSYEVQAEWDLWAYDGAGLWSPRPQKLEIFCFGEEYDEGLYREAGHFQIGVGFEHLFTGHAGLLGSRPLATPQHPVEAKFLEKMSQPENLRVYREKTCENIRRLFAGMRRIETALPVERWRLWSEGEENFEARLDDILALR